MRKETPLVCSSCGKIFGIHWDEAHKFPYMMCFLCAESMSNIFTLTNTSNWFAGRWTNLKNSGATIFISVYSLECSNQVKTWLKHEGFWPWD